jgi:hypothetical protein
VRGEDTLVG